VARACCRTRRPQSHSSFYRHDCFCARHEGDHFDHSHRIRDWRGPCQIGSRGKSQPSWRQFHWREFLYQPNGSETAGGATRTCPEGRSDRRVAQPQHPSSTINRGIWMMHPAHLASKFASKVPATSVRLLQLSRLSRESRRRHFLLELTHTSTVSAHWSLSRRHSFGFPPSMNGESLRKLAG